MGSRDKRRAMTYSSDSCTDEPVAVRRRVDIDGNFAVTRRRHISVGQQSPRPDEASADNRNEPLLDFTFSKIRRKVQTMGSEYFKNILAGNANTFSTGSVFSSGGIDLTSNKGNDQCRQSLIQRKTCMGGNERQQGTVVVASKSTDRCNRSERSNSEEKGIRAIDETVSHQYSISDTESSSEAEYWSSDFELSSFSLLALDVSYEKAEAALKMEKEREEDILTTINGQLSKVSSLMCELHGTKAPIGKFVTEVLNNGLEKWRERGISDNKSSMDQRFEAIRAYVLDVCIEHTKQTRGEYSKEPVTQICREPLTEASSSEDDSRKNPTVGKVHKLLEKTSRKSRNVVVRQCKIMHKLCAVAEKVVAKTEISCRAVLNCLKTIVNVLDPAVGMSWIMAQAERNLESEGKGIAKFSDAASVTRQFTYEALCDAEVAVGRHREASRALHAAWADLEVMRSYLLHGDATFCRLTATGDRLLDMTRQSNVSLEQVRECERNIKLMRGTLLPLLSDMRNHRALTEEWSDMCGVAVPVSICALCTVTEGCCSAIEATVEGLSLLAYDSMKN